MSKPTIYAQHDAAFPLVSASVIAKDGERVATIAFKYPRDGAGRLYAYVHWIGDEMVRGMAGGGGYDKRSAACYQAAKKIEAAEPAEYSQDDAMRATFAEALKAGHDGAGWDSALRAAGFMVWNAV